MDTRVEHRAPLFDVVIPTRRLDARADDLLDDLRRELAPFAARVGRIVAADDRAVTDVRDRLIGQGGESRLSWPSPVNGPAVNRNRGARDSHATWLAFVDDDVRLPSGWGQALVDVLLSDPPLDIFGGRLDSLQPHNWFSQASEDFVVRHRRYPEGWYLASAHVVIRRDAFQQLGGFSEAFAYCGEDWDLCQRAHTLGLRVGVEPSVIVRHANPTNWRQLALKAQQYGRANADLDARATEASGGPPESAGGHLPSPTRALRWLGNEYRTLRNDGRSLTRSVRTLAVYMPWMAIYLKAQRRAGSSGQLR